VIAGRQQCRLEPSLELRRSRSCSSAAAALLDDGPDPCVEAGKRPFALGDGRLDLDYLFDNCRAAHLLALLVAGGLHEKVEPGGALLEIGDQVPVLIGQRGDQTEPVVEVLHAVREQKQLQQPVTTAGLVDASDALCQLALPVRLVGLGVRDIAAKL
jgi:hypothetical protein